MLKDHINRIYSENKDMRTIIEAIQPELNVAFQQAQDYFSDTFAIIATPDGILGWEDILDIVPDSTTESMQFRRERILNRLSSNVPFTEKWLHEIMDRIMGPNAWNYTLSIEDFVLIVESLRPGKLWLNEMTLTLDKIIPANMLWYLVIYYDTWQSVLDTYETWGNVLGLRSHETQKKYNHAELSGLTHNQIRTNNEKLRTWQNIMESKED